MSLKIETLAVGPLEENCYLVWNPDTAHLYIVDPGDEADRIVEAARRYPYRQATILLTHAHIDHIAAVGAVSRALEAPVLLRAADLPLYRSPANAIPPWLPAAADLPDTAAPVDTAEYKVLELPGHTPGGAGYYFPEGPALFAGDTIFHRSVGRTDLPGGDWEALQNSIRTRIFTLPEALPIHCGHGPVTTVGDERRLNPYLQE